MLIRPAAGQPQKSMSLAAMSNSRLGKETLSALFCYEFYTYGTPKTVYQVDLFGEAYEAELRFKNGLTTHALKNAQGKWVKAKNKDIHEYTG